MSGRYVSRVLESALGSELKFTAAIFASFADEDGRCWPSIGQVAYLRGVGVRAVQYHVKELQHMDILQILRPATQWLPPHYRVALEQLPARAPYRPPDRQESLFRPRGESPGPDPSGVQPTAPPSGVQSSASGVQPVAPDPSVRSVSTHTYRGAREAGVQPAAPLTANSAGESALPLIVAPRRDLDHAAHAWCGRICVPKFLHRQLKRALGGPIARRARRMRTFYVETIAALSPARPIGADPVKFWRAAFADRFHRQSEARPARLAVGGSIACPHDPQCRTIGDCTIRTLAEARADRARKSG